MPSRRSERGQEALREVREGLGRLLGGPGGPHGGPGPGGVRTSSQKIWRGREALQKVQDSLRGPRGGTEGVGSPPEFQVGLGSPPRGVGMVGRLSWSFERGRETRTSSRRCSRGQDNLWEGLPTPPRTTIGLYEPSRTCGRMSQPLLDLCEGFLDLLENISTPQISGGPGEAGTSSWRFGRVRKTLLEV